MATVIFDTYKAVRQLREAGFDESQAAAMVSTMCDVLGGNLATKEDIQDMATKADVAAVRQEMATKEDLTAVRQEMATKAEVAAVRREMATKEDLAAVRQEMATKEELASVRREMATKEDIASVRREMATKEDIASVRREMDSKPDKADLHAQETRLTIRMGGMIFGGIGLVLAILRLFPDFFG